MKMTAIPPPPPENIAAKKWVPVLLIGVIGIGVVLAAYILIGGFQTVELPLMLLIVLWGAWGYNRGAVRGLLTVIILYVATAFAALGHAFAAPYVAAVQQVARFDLGASLDQATRSSIALAFILLTIVFWGILELLRRGLIPSESSGYQTNILDGLFGVGIHILVGVLVAAIIFNAYGYGPSRPIHNYARLRPYLNQILYLLYSAQSFWFGGNPPPLYTYDLYTR